MPFETYTKDEVDDLLEGKAESNAVADLAAELAELREAFDGHHDVTEPEPEPDVYASTSFENGFDFHTNTAANGGAGYQLVDDFARTGTHSVRLDHTGGSSGIRLNWKNHENASESDDFNLPDDALYEAWYYIPAPVDVSWWLLMEIKQQQGNTSHPLYTVIQDSQGELRLESRVRADGSIASNIVRGWGSGVDIPVGDWFKLGLRYRVSDGLDGIVQVFLNDELVVDVDGVRTHADWSHSSYAQNWIVASYGAGHSPSNHSIWVDDLTVSLI